MKRKGILAFLLLGTIWALPAQAIMIKYSLEQLTTGSEKIATGVVEATEARAIEPGGAIYTYVTIGVENMIKGDVKEEKLVLRVPGGTLGDQTMVVSDAPFFEVGERTLVFVTRQVDGQDIVYNWQNGKYTIRNGMVVEEGTPLENFLLVINAYLDSDNQE